MATISSHHARAALGGLQRKGYSAESALIQAGINPKSIALPNARINEEQMTQLVQIIRKTLSDEFMGFTPSPCKVGAFAFMVRSVRTTETLREALNMGMAFYNLMTDDITTVLTETHENAEISIEFKAPGLDPDNFYLDFWLIIWHRLASWIIGTRIPLKNTQLTHEQPSHGAELTIMFPGELQLGQTENKLTFARELLNAPLVRNQTEVEDFVIHSPAQLLTIPGDDKTLSHKISNQLSKPVDNRLQFPPIEILANQLAVSPQTLHRRLKREGTSYQRIKDNIRRDLALSKLIHEHLPIHQVAEIVGFSEPRSFTRAFKQWTGLSPREYCKFI